MSNERPDSPSDNEDRPPPDWPGAAKAREQAEAAENQVLPPDIEPYEPEPSVLSHVENEPVIIGNSGRTEEEQAAVDAQRAAEREGQRVPDTPTPRGLTDADINAISDLPVDPGAPQMDAPDFPDLAVAVGPESQLQELSAALEEPDPLGGDVAVIVNPGGESFAVSNAPRRGNPMLMYGGIVAALAVLIVGLLVVLGGGGGNDDDATAGDPPGTTGAEAAAPTSPPPTSPPAPPAAFTANAQQLRNANVIATDLLPIYGTCAYEIPTNGATDVEQSVSSSPAMMQAMTAAGYQGFRTSSRTPTPCQGLPYSAASVVGNARDVAAALALFTAARTNYQALFPGFTTFEVQRGQLDEAYCQYGVFAPAGNIIAVVCWLREGTTVSGVFILLPPGSAQGVIDEAMRDAQAYVTRVDGVLR